MATEYRLSFTASEIDEKLEKIDNLAEQSDLTAHIENKSNPHEVTADQILEDVELPQRWVDMNDAYEAFGEPDHKIMGGLVYKDFEGNTQVFPLARPYGIRTEECGGRESSVAVYNSAQQLLVKPGTDGRHTVSLRQLDEIFGGGSTSDLSSEKIYSIGKNNIPPVDTTDPHPYVFGRDENNVFSAKNYNEEAIANNLIDRDAQGKAKVEAPDVNSTTPDSKHVVNVDYANRKYLAKTGGIMTGKPEIKTSNPAVKFTDTADSNSVSYVQAYQGKTYMGYSAAKSISVDKNGNGNVPGNLTVVGSISCGEPKNGTDAVTVDYLNKRLNNGSQGLTFTSNGGGTCSISGIGTCTDTDIVIPKVAPDGDKVTSIGYQAFYNCSSLTSVTIPDSVTSISDLAFSGCSSLTSVTIPDGVTSIGYQVFYNCSSLTSVTIPDGVTSIGWGAFSYCSSLTSIVIPDSVTSIGTQAFRDCISLTSIVIPDGITYINNAIFYNCSSLTSITIPNSVTSIDIGAFSECSSLTTVVIPNSVANIAGSLFFNCPSLTIYCEAASQPEGWNSTWNDYNRPVVWGAVIDIPSANTKINSLETRLANLEASAVSVLSGPDAPANDIGEDGDLYLVVE